MVMSVTFKIRTGGAVGFGRKAMTQKPLLWMSGSTELHGFQPKVVDGFAEGEIMVR